MLRILIPIDFSEASRTALRHARWLGQRMPVQISLLYVASPPDANGAAKASQMKLLQDRMERFAEPEPDDLWDFPIDVPIERRSVRFGFRVPDEIVAAIRDFRPELVMLGVRRKPTLWQQLFGSVSTTLLREMAAPLVVVPESTPVQPIERIGLAVDLNVSESGQGQILKTVAQHLQATIQPFSVAWFPARIPEQRKLLAHKKEWVEAMGATHMDLFRPEHYEKGIDAYIKAHPVQWLAIHAPGKRYLEKLFRQSILRGMPFRTRVPLLVFFD